jgi:hypothetical protein
MSNSICETPWKKKRKLYEESYFFEENRIAKLPWVNLF